MMVSDEERRWIVVGIAMNKVLSPVLLEPVKKGMEATVAKLDTHCGSLTPPCTLKTLSYSQVKNDSMLKKLSFQNINNNHVHLDKKAFNYNVNSAVDLAKIFLPRYLAHFWDFDYSLDMSASLRLLGCTQVVPAPFTNAIKNSADDVRDNVRNKWGHFNRTDWTEAFFIDCFSKMETLVRLLGLAAADEKKTLDDLTDWKTKGCRLCMGHAVDKDLITLVQQELQRLIEDQANIKSKLSAFEGEEQRLQRKETEKILEKLTCLDGTLIRLDAVEEGLARTDKRVEKLEGTHSLDPERSPEQAFDQKLCRSNLAKYYKETATVPTSGWSKKATVDIHQMYTRLSWVKREETSSGTSLTELKHYSDLFKADMNGVTPKRILVQGYMGIGKSTFVKKLAVDWAELEKIDEENSAALKNFEVVLAIDLREVGECRDLRDVIRRSNIFAEENMFLAEGLLSYITKNQEKVLLVFDGYEEYLCGRDSRDSDVYKIFIGKKLRDCCVLITAQSHKADELLESKAKVMLVEIKGFSIENIETAVRKLFGNNKDGRDLLKHLLEHDLLDLAKVPLLLLFFSTSWKEGKLKSFIEYKTELLLAIVQFLLDYIQRKQSHYFNEVQHFEEDLAKIGDVAFQCLLSDDLVVGCTLQTFLDGIRYKNNYIIGLIQVAEYTCSVRPATMVSFIDRSIQQFLAARYINYECCIPEGNLGPLKVVHTLEKCEAFQKVFQFICGLTDEGAEAVFKHLTFVRRSDCSLQVNTEQDEERDTDVPFCDVTERHRRFNDLVFHCFQEVKSKDKIAPHTCDSVGGTFLVTKTQFRFPTMINNLNCCFLFREPQMMGKGSISQVKSLQEWLKFLDKKGFELKRLDTFVSKFLTVGAECHQQLRGSCGFNVCLCFLNGKVFIYIIDLHLTCSTHASLFFAEAQRYDHDPVLILKFVRTITFIPNNNALLAKALFENCKRLRQIELCATGVQSCDILKQLPKPHKCELKIGTFNKISLSAVYSLSSALTCYLESAGALQFADLLAEFENTTSLALDLSDCSETSVITLVSKIPSKRIASLRLKGIGMTRDVAAALGKLLPKLSSLRVLQLTGRESPANSEVADVETLFGGFHETSVLKELHLCRFNFWGSLSSLTKQLCFFPNLEWVILEFLNLDERDLNDLMKSYTFLPSVRELSLRGNALRCSEQDLVDYITKLHSLGSLWLAGTDWPDQKQTNFEHLVSQHLPQLALM